MRVGRWFRKVAGIRLPNAASTARGIGRTGRGGAPAGLPARLAAILAAGILGLGASAETLAAQERFVVDGRVVVETTGAGVAGIDVVLSGRSQVTTDGEGRFRFRDVAPGRHTLTARGIGYRTAELELTVSGDTTVVIEVELVPVAMDTLGVEAEEARVRGRVRDAELDTWLIDAEVYGTPDLEDTTDPIGRFDLGDVPTLVPLTVRVESFGFLPESVTFEPRRDTTLEFSLEPDPVARHMIARQMERIDRRVEGSRYEALPVLDRAELMGRHSGPILEVLELRLGRRMFRKIGCFIIDEEPFNRWRLHSIQVDRIQRVEILEMELHNNPLAVRIYTRDFVQNMVRGEAELMDRRLVLTSVALPVCRAAVPPGGRVP